MWLNITIVGCLPDNKQSSSFCGTSGPYNICALGGWPLCPTGKKHYGYQLGGLEGGMLIVVKLEPGMVLLVLVVEVEVNWEV